jgi:hypothetical protein
VLEVLQRNEKALAWELNERGVGYYLPMTQRVRLHGGQRRKVTSPLFPGYLFVAGGPEVQGDLCERREHPEILRLIRVVDQCRLVDELSSLEIVLQANPQFGVLIDVPVGARRRVIAGSLEGVEVIICQYTGKTVLAVNVLNRAMEIEIDPAFLEPA